MLRPVIYFLLVVLSLPLVGCVQVSPDPIDPQPNAARLVGRSLSQPVVAEALAHYALQFPLNSAWTLDQLTVAAWTLRPDVAVAEAELHLAHVERGLAEQRPNPSLDITSERVVSGGDGSPWVLGVSPVFQVETKDKRGVRRARAQAEVNLLEWRLGETLWSIRSMLRGRAFALQFADQQGHLDDEEVQLRQDFLDLIDTRVKLGAASSQDRLIAAEGLRTAERGRDLNMAQFTAARANFAATIGVTVNNAPPVSIEVPVGTEARVLDTEIEQARTIALTNRLDIRQALANYEIAEQDLKAAVAEQYPNLNIGPGYLFDQSDQKITLSLSLPIPLFHSGKAEIDRARASRRLEASRFDKVQADALAEIETSLAAYQTSVGLLTAARQAEEQSRQLLEITEDRLRAGAANRGDVLIAQLELVGRRRTTLEANRALVDAIGALEDSVQRPLYPKSSLTLGAEAKEEGP